MRRRGLLVVALCLLEIGLCAGQASLSLTECYALARANYPLIKRMDLIDRSESYSLDNAAKAWLPQVNVSAQASYQSDVTKLPFDQEKISALIPGFEIPVLDKDQYRAVAEVNQMIWDGGGTRATKAVVRAEAEVSKSQLENDLYLLNDRVNQLYFGCLLQDELLEQNRLLLADLEVNLARIEAMERNGVANRSDWESLRVAQLEARQQRVGIEASGVAFRRMLAELIGLSADSLRLETPADPGLLSMTVARLELRYFEALENLSQTRERQLTAGWMPRVGAFVQGGYGRPGLDMLDVDFAAYYVAGIRLTWNLGKLYTLANDRRKLATERREIEARRETFLLNTRLDLLNRQEEIRRLSEQLRDDEEIIELRTSVKEAAEAKLQNGVISVADLIREINAVDQARQEEAIRRLRRLMAIYDYIYVRGE